jgi:hypothetical protein
MTQLCFFTISEEGSQPETIFGRQKQPVVLILDRFMAGSIVSFYV